jgi:hypothetical protein
MKRTTLEEIANEHVRITSGVDEVKCFIKGAEYAQLLITDETSEDTVMKWLHENYLDSYDKYTSSYHRIIVKDLLKELARTISK